MKQGLIQGQMPQEQGQPAGSQDSPADQGGADLSQQEAGQPSEQQMKLEMAAKKVLYDEKSNAQVLESIKSGAANDPYRAVAQSAFVLMADLDQRSGGKIPPEDLIPAAMTIMEEVALMAVTAGAVDIPGVTMGEDNSPMIQEDTLGRLAQNLVAIAIENGVIDPEDIQGMASEYSEEELQGIVAQQDALAGGDQAAAMKSQAAGQAQGELTVQGV